MITLAQILGGILLISAIFIGFSKILEFLQLGLKYKDLETPKNEETKQKQSEEPKCYSGSSLLSRFFQH